jgi:autotransporter-associated beta strand protein
MKQSPILRSVVFRSLLPSAFAACCLLNSTAIAARIWDGGGADNNSNTAANWDDNVWPTTGPLTFAGTTRTTVVWNGINSAAPMNLGNITFSGTAGAFQINQGTQVAIQFVSNGTSILNSSSNLQTLGIQSTVFFNGTKTFDAGTAGLALTGGIIFRGDAMTTGQINRLDLIGSGDSTTSTISRAGTFAGTATTSLVKNGTGKWTITGNVTDTGTTTISGGTLEYQGSIASSSIANNSAMILNHASNFSYGNNITGSGTLTKSGAGVFTLSGSNSYSGATVISGGTLAVNGSLSNTSSVTVQTGATLQGNGTISSAVTIQGNGTLASGETIESLGTAALTFEANSTLAYQLNNDAAAGVAGDLTFVSGNLTLALTNNSILTLTELGAGSWSNGEKLTLISYTGSWNGGLFDYLGTDITDDSQITFSGATWQFNYNDTVEGTNYISDSTGSYVTMTVIPEPRAALLGCLGALLLLRRRR